MSCSGTGTLSNTGPTSPSRSTRGTRPIITRRTTVDCASIARPDSMSLAQLTSKRTMQFKKDLHEEDGAELDADAVGNREADRKEGGAVALQTATGMSSIDKKEEALEQIMCAEAFAGFQQMNRHQLNHRQMSRCCVDVSRHIGFEEDRAWEVIDGSDMAEVLSDSDDDFTLMEGMDVHIMGPNDKRTVPCRGLRIGHAFAPPSTTESFELERMFVAYCGCYTLLGIANSHGIPEHAHELVRFVIEEMPKSVFRSPRLAGGDVVGAMGAAFRRVHRKAIENVDCRFTGCACTLLMIAEEHIWIGHVGDCRAVLGVPDNSGNAEAFHFHPVNLTPSHHLSQMDEFDRVIEEGGEVRRLVGDNVHRMFLKDEAVPGLLLTRAIGDRVAHMVGLSHTPTLGYIDKRDLPDNSFILLGGGGLWATMSDRGVVNYVGKYFQDANEAASSVAREGLRRWEDPSTRARTCIADGEPDCFGCLILFPNQTGMENAREVDSKAPRPFAIGSHYLDGIVSPLSSSATLNRPRRTWRDMKAVNRTLTIKRQAEAIEDTGPRKDYVMDFQVTHFSPGSPRA